MNRTDIEVTLSRDRAWLLETIGALPEHELDQPATTSAHDPAKTWNVKDHLSHLAGFERVFNAIIQRYLRGDRDPIGLQKDEQGAIRTMEQILAVVDRMNEEWVEEHRGRTLSGVVAVGQQARAETLELLGSLSDEQLTQKIAGAPWGDGTLGGILAANADHGRMHWKWVKEATAARA